MPCFAWFWAVFRPEKRKHRSSLRQSADVLPAKYGGLCPRCPMFFGLKHGISPILCPQKYGFNGKICLPPPFLLWKRYFVLLSICSNISQFGRNFTLEGTRSLVRIFEGFCGGFSFSFHWMTERNGKVCNSFYLPVQRLSAPHFQRFVEAFHILGATLPPVLFLSGGCWFLISVCVRFALCGIFLPEKSRWSVFLPPNCKM